MILSFEIRPTSLTKAKSNTNLPETPTLDSTFLNPEVTGTNREKAE